MNPTSTPEPEPELERLAAAALRPEPAASFQPAPGARFSAAVQEMRISKVRGGFVLIVAGELFAVASEPAAIGGLVAEWAGSV